MNNPVENVPESGAHIAVIGAGITGLAAAHRLIAQDPQCRVSIFEASDRAGGIIRTEHSDGFLMEFGPDSFITNKPGGVQLCEELGITDQLISTDNRYRRSLVLSKGRPLPVPDGFMLMAPAKPWAIARTRILSFRGKLRLLREAFIRPRSTDSDESLADFVRRRFGGEALDRLIQPLVGGIYTSDPEKLSLQATLPRFPEMERTHGSVIRATLAQQKRNAARREEVSGSGARYGLFATPRDGLSSLVSRATEVLTASGHVEFRFSTSVANVRPENSRWVLSTERGDESFDGVVVTLPTHKAASMLDSSSMPQLINALREIEYASSAIVVTAHRLADFSHPMDAFGVVVPMCEGRDVLAVSCASRKFVGRAPDGKILLRTFVGGAMQPELLERSDDELRETVSHELRDIFGMSADPLFSHVVRYQNAMPQYHVGHTQRIQDIESLAENLPGLRLAGSAYHGVGIPDSISSGRDAADAMIHHQQSASR